MAKHSLKTTFTYRIFTWILFPAACIFCLFTAIKHRHLAYIFHRIGRYPKINNSGKVIWCHCASVGELNTALPLLKKLIENNYHLLVSTNTLTSKQVFDNASLPNSLHVFLPLDYHKIANRFINKFNPEYCLVFETELWPSILLATLNRNIPVSILNGRISDKTFNAPSFLKTNYQKILANISHIIASNQENARRFITLGADAHRVQIYENLKFANLSLTKNENSERPLAHRYFLCASTHEGEEKGILKAWNKNRPIGFGLVIAIRHPHRNKDVCNIIKQSGCTFALHSEQPTDVSLNDIYVIDTIGDLIPFYQHADIVFMGGSLAPIGGHNVLEPAEFEKCIITGPHFQSFTDIVQGLLDCKGIIVINNYAELIQEVITLINDDELRTTVGKNSKQYLSSKINLLEEYAKAVLKILN